jgi:hypothetical protein
MTPIQQRCLVRSAQKNRVMMMMMMMMIIIIKILITITIMILGIITTRDL